MTLSVSVASSKPTQCSQFPGYFLVHSFLVGSRHHVLRKVDSWFLFEASLNRVSFQQASVTLGRATFCVAARTSLPLTPMLFTCLIVLSLAASCTLLFHPLWFIRMLARWNPDILWYGGQNRNSASHTSNPPARPRIFLTIDDAPNGTRTSAILTLLKQYDAKATFFCIGSHMQSLPHETNEILAAGHSIGNHTMLDRPSYQLSPEELGKDVDQTQQIIEKAMEIFIARNVTQGQRIQKMGAQGTRFFRPGHGFFNESMLKMAKERGLKIVLGSLYPFDPQIRIAWIIVLLIKLRIWCSAKADEHILIVHDHEWGPTVLASILPFLRQQGYDICDLTQIQS